MCGLSFPEIKSPNYRTALMWRFFIAWCIPLLGGDFKKNILFILGCDIQQLILRDVLKYAQLQSAIIIKITIFKIPQELLACEIQRILYVNKNTTLCKILILP
jgi:hypothetical protein